MRVRRRALTLLAATLLVYAVLVAGHDGEFWPFSIYPMFSQAGHPWSRAVVRRVEADAEPSWQAVSAGSLPGRSFAAGPQGIKSIGLANFVSETRRWDADRVAGLRRIFHDQTARSSASGASAGSGEKRQALLVMRVGGRLADSDSVAVRFVPYALLRPDTTLLNPRLPR